MLSSQPSSFLTIAPRAASIVSIDQVNHIIIQHTRNRITANGSEKSRKRQDIVDLHLVDVKAVTIDRWKRSKQESRSFASGKVSAQEMNEELEDWNKCTIVGLVRFLIYSCMTHLGELGDPLTHTRRHKQCSL